MLDIKLIRQDRESTEKKLKQKDASIDLSKLATTDEQLRSCKQEVEELKSKRNDLSKRVGELKRSGKDAQQEMAEAAALGEKISELDASIRQLDTEFEAAIAVLPNICFDEIKVSLDPADNVCLKKWGEKPNFSFKPKNHLEISDVLGLFDLPRGAKMSGTGWPVYRGKAARLEWALLQYFIDFHVKNGYEQLIVPHCVRPEAMYGAGQLPKFKDQAFKVADDDYQLYLIPTAEVAINALHLDEIMEESQLPARYCAYTPCFRREAGAAGTGERGLIRVHQFNKVEMFCFTKPEESEQIFEEMVGNAEKLIEGLGLHYKRMLLVTGDTSFPSAKTIDLEVWLPGQDRYYEVSSISNCTDFQARRSKTRFKRGQDKPELVHTLNGSGLATSRVMVALLENFQKEDGSVVVPEVLRPFLGGIEKL